MTDVVKTISSTGSPDYSTPALWEAGVTSLYSDDLVTNTVRWIGEIQNASDNFSGTGTRLTIGGSTVNSSYYKWLRTAGTASFKDNASASTNALRYNESNGCSLKTTDNNDTVNITENYARITGIQISNTSSLYSANTLTIAATGVKIEQCILDSNTGNASSRAVSCSGSSSSTISSSLLVQRKSAATRIGVFDNATVVNCTLAVPNDLTDPTNAIYAFYSSTFKNCAIYGCTNVYDTGGTAPTFTTCYTDVASPPSGCTTASYSTSAGAYFQNISDGTHDYRVSSASSSLYNNGTYDATNAPNDIIGTAFGSGTTSAGCWQFSAGGGGSSLPVFHNHYVSQGWG